MAKCAEPTQSTCLSLTRNAVMAIENPALREDFLHFLEGAEYCYAVGEVQMAVECMRNMLAATVVLNRSVGPDVALGVIDGVLEDTRSTARAMRGAFGFDKNYDEKCDIKPGTPIGSSSCVTSKGSTCYTIGGAGGCGGSSGFRFVWESRYRLA